jgi:hypothetical protein
MSALSVSQIFEAFGGVRPLARRLKVPVATASSWKRSESIPHWRLREIEEAAAADGIKLTAPRKRAA